MEGRKRGNLGRRAGPAGGSGGLAAELGGRAASSPLTNNLSCIVLLQDPGPKAGF